jgi:hypothetical protein
MWFWNRPHRHYWTVRRTNAINGGGGEIITYQCFSCGSIRYDKVDASGLVSSKITDDKGRVQNGESVENADERQI